MLLSHSTVVVYRNEWFIFVVDCWCQLSINSHYILNLNCWSFPPIFFRLFPIRFRTHKYVLYSRKFSRLAHSFDAKHHLLSTCDFPLLAEEFVASIVASYGMWFDYTKSMRVSALNQTILFDNTSLQTFFARTDTTFCRLILGPWTRKKTSLFCVCDAFRDIDRWDVYLSRVQLNVINPQTAVISPVDISKTVRHIKKWKINRFAGLTISTWVLLHSIYKLSNPQYLSTCCFDTC